MLLENFGSTFSSLAVAESWMAVPLWPLAIDSSTLEIVPCADERVDSEMRKPCLLD